MIAVGAFWLDMVPDPRIAHIKGRFHPCLLAPFSDVENKERKSAYLEVISILRSLCLAQITALGCTVIP